MNHKRAYSIRRATFVCGVAALLAVSAWNVQAGASRAHASARAASLPAAPAKTTAARVLVTPKGRTLYVFALDAKDKSACTDTCAKFWPPRLVSSTAHPPAKIAGIPGTFGVITRADGTRQLTYDGAPLYTFLEDKAPGQMNGQGVLASGGYWWAVVAAGH